METIPIPGAEIYYQKNFLSPEQATTLFNMLRTKCVWERRRTSFKSPVVALHWKRRLALLNLKLLSTIPVQWRCAGTVDFCTGTVDKVHAELRLRFQYSNAAHKTPVKVRLGGSLSFAA
jgi:hypothetical protein